MPSYGPGGDFGKTTEVGSPLSPERVGYYKGEHRRRRKIGIKFSIRKSFLILLVIACLAIVGWASYLLHTGKITPLVGGIILAVGIMVLLWNISTLKRYRAGTWAIVSILLLVALVGATVSAFAGVEPFEGYKDNIVDYVTGLFLKYDVEILPAQISGAEDWAISLDGGGWKGSTLTVKLTITNLGPRRNFGYASFIDVGPELAVIDSTGKLVEPWVPTPDIMKGEFFISYPPYTKEFYPGESWSGSLKFEMSTYSGTTKLYMTRYYHVRRYFLFNLGSPIKD